MNVLFKFWFIEQRKIFSKFSTNILKVLMRNNLFCQDGMLIQEQSIKSLDLSELDFENTNKSRDDEDDQLEPKTDDEITEGGKEEEEGEDKTNLAQKINLVQNAQKLRSPRVEEEKTFDKILDIMEVF